MGLSSSRPPGQPVPTPRGGAPATGAAGFRTRQRVVSHLQPPVAAAAANDDDYDDDADDNGVDNGDDGRPPQDGHRRRRHGRHRSRSLDFLAPLPPVDASAAAAEAGGASSSAAAAAAAPRRPPRSSDHRAQALILRHLGVPASFYRADIRCPVCGKTVPYDDTEMHLVICLTKPRISYNEDVLTEDKGAECAICLDDLCQGDTIARLPCLCIYHKGCIDEWFKKSRSCPEHPGDG